MANPLRTLHKQSFSTAHPFLSITHQNIRAYINLFFSSKTIENVALPSFENKDKIKEIHINSKNIIKKEVLYEPE